MGKALELSIAILNGAVGDYLARTGNGLATPMSVIAAGRPIALTTETLAEAFPSESETKAKLVVLVHGLMCSEDIWDFPDGSTYGTRLGDDLGLVPVVLRYNSGLSIAENGRAFDALLEELSQAFPRPIEEIVLLGYSMGGLVIRSAVQIAEARSSSWLSIVRRAVYVASPHQGAPMERAGRELTKLLRLIPDPVVQSVAEIAETRSRGVKDLGDAVLGDDHEGQRVKAWPLSPRMDHYLVAGSLARHPDIAELLGDFMVPLPSGSDGHHGLTPKGTLPASHVRVVYGASHMGMAHHPEAYEAIRTFLQEPS